MKDRTKAQLRGDGWVIYIDKLLDEWAFEGDWSGLAVAEMLNEHFQQADIEAHRMESFAYGREYGMLFPLAAEFLNKWGINCEVDGLPPVTPEALPLPND